MLNLFEDLAGLAWKHAHKNQVTLVHHSLIVELSNHSKFLSEWSQQMRLSGADKDS